jgi:hypothetical protein
MNDTLANLLSAIAAIALQIGVMIYAALPWIAIIIFTLLMLLFFWALHHLDDVLEFDQPHNDSGCDCDGLEDLPGLQDHAEAARKTL